MSLVELKPGGRDERRRDRRPHPGAAVPSTGRKAPVLRAVVLGCLVVASSAALWFNTWNPQLWIPNIVSNLVTTALAIYVINVFIDRLERLEKEREEQERKSLEQIRSRRHERRLERRKLMRRSMMQAQVNWPVRSTLDLGRQIMEAASSRDLQGALAHIRGRKARCMEHADALAQMITVYNRYMTFKELNWLEGLRRAVRRIAIEGDADIGDDGHKAAIMSFLEYLNGFALALGQAFVDQEMIDEQGVFNERMAALNRAWEIPKIRQRLRKQGHSEEKKTAPSC